MIADHVGRETVLSALGREFRVSRWTRKVWDDFLQWARPRIPDPLDVVSKQLDKFPPAMQELMVRHACDRGCDYLGVGSPAIQQCLGSLEGSVHLLYLLLRGNHPDVTEDMALDIALSVGNDQLRQAFDSAAGKTPPIEGNVTAPAV